MLVAPVHADDRTFKVALVDDVNPPGTEYRVLIFNNRTEELVDTGWSEARCRPVAMQPDSLYLFYVKARNFAGRESEREELYTMWVGDSKIYTPTDDPWLSNRLNEVADIYGLTDAGHDLLFRLRWRLWPNEPGRAGYWGLHRGIEVGHITNPWTYMHEAMHAWWQHWDGFPQSCDEMNIWTFRRDMANFIADFIRYERSGEPNPLEAYRPYFNGLTGFLGGYQSDEGHTAWQLLAGEEFWGADLWHLVYHVAETEIPMWTLNRRWLIPPTLRPYFDGFIEWQDDDGTTWQDDIRWYGSLELEDRWLLDTAVSRFYWWPSRFSGSPEHPYRTKLNEPLRSQAQQAERQALIDFVNTLEDQACNRDCEALWDAAPAFWVHYTNENLVRAVYYLPDIGPLDVELRPGNWRALRSSLELMIETCDSTEGNTDSLSRLIAGSRDLSDTQKVALDKMLNVERKWFCRYHYDNIELEDRIPKLPTDFMLRML